MHNFFEVFFFKEKYLRCSDTKIYLDILKKYLRLFVITAFRFINTSTDQTLDRNPVLDFIDTLHSLMIFNGPLFQKSIAQHTLEQLIIEISSERALVLSQSYNK